MNNISEPEKKRASNFELLRIVSMIFIIMHHYSVHGGFEFAQSLTFNKCLIRLMAIGGKLGVNCFVFISGYFLIKSKFHLRSLVKLIFQVVFYSILFFMIYFWSIGIRSGQTGLEMVLGAIFPITYEQYWFATTYVVMYILTPFINKMILNLKKQEHFRLIVILTIMWAIIPELKIFSYVALEFSNLGWFIFLYTLASYVRLYPCNYFQKYKMNKWIFIISYIGIFTWSFGFDLLTAVTGYSGGGADYLNTMNLFPVLVCSFSLFLTFKNLDIKYRKTINVIASTTFGIYLIHDNCYVRTWLWQCAFSNAEYLESSFLIVHAICAVSLVFFGCSLIEYIRLQMLEKNLFRLLENQRVMYCNHVLKTKIGNLCILLLNYLNR